MVRVRKASHRGDHATQTDIAARSRETQLAVPGRGAGAARAQRKRDGGEISSQRRFARYGALTLPTFITIGYGSQEGYDRTDPAVRDAAHGEDGRLREGGALMGIAGAPVQVRNWDAKGIDTKEGPFMCSALPIAGFAVIEAANLDEAVKMVAQSPCAVAHGVVEVWPLTLS
jgi:hypothetical protein